MCGIFGICYAAASGITASETKKLMDHLFLYSQSRGKEASGVMLKSGHERLVYKETLIGERFIKTTNYKSLFKPEYLNSGHDVMIMGHARLDTSGSKWDNNNNSPLEYDGTYGIHNGIITNADDLWKQNPDLQQRRAVDSEILLALFSAALKRGATETTALAKLFAVIEGSASVALYDAKKNSLSMATNTGSLYFTQYSAGLFVFASERYILEQLHKKMRFLKKQGGGTMRHLRPNTSLVLHLDSLTCEPYEGGVAYALL